MRLFTSLFFLSIVFFFVECRKNIGSDKQYTISGKILESSSNPIPVSNYRLKIYQSKALSFLGSLGGIDQVILTDNDGIFNFSYTPKTGSGIYSHSTNPNPISVSGYDTVKYKSLYPEFNPISANVDNNLSIVFLFKKIDKLVRKVKFNNSLSSDDSLEVITTDASGAKYKTLHGPIPSNTLLVVDTIFGYKISRLNLNTNQYTILSVLKKPMYQTDLNLLGSIGDENYREILMTY